ncbi:hypothetical protein ACGFR6_36335 [Streptomyces sp. NPDC048567]|uniref:hypothetical protein n=1 Tax=Streptomyces sp. NPDC048567 TaxID=3365570 RepID=UPI003722E921
MPPAVREAVMATDGALVLVHAIAAYLAGPRQDEPLTRRARVARVRHRFNYRTKEF